MLPKPEKTKKLNKNLLGDAQITQESDEVVAAKRLKTKRRLVLVSLCLTVGLSFSFWSFRQIQAIIHSPKSFSFPSSFKLQLPQINSTSQNSTPDSSLQNFLKNKNWSVVSAFNNKLDKPVFSFNFDNSSLQSNLDQLNSIKKTNQSSINLNLPQGLLFQEKIDTTSFISYQNLITLPNSQLFIFIKIPDTSDINKINSDLSQLVDLLYWYSVSQLNSD